MQGHHKTSSFLTIRWQIWLLLLITISVSIPLYIITHNIPEIPSTGPIGQNRTLKERMIFAAGLERNFHKKGWIAKIDMEGVDGKVINIYWDQLNVPFVRMIVKSKDIIGDIREMGFKRLLMSNGKDKWDIDLKN